MRATAIDYRNQPGEPAADDISLQPKLMTPARRAGLDELEREFKELLRASARQPSAA